MTGAGFLADLPGFGTGRFNVVAFSPQSGNVGDSNVGDQGLKRLLKLKGGIVDLKTKIVAKEPRPDWVVKTFGNA